MPITEKQRELRKRHLGSSDVAAILGVDPYKSAYDVWADKTGKVEAFEPNEAMNAGTRFEDGVLEEAEQRFGRIRRNQYRSASDYHIGANIDAIVLSTNEPIDAKTAGLFGPLSPDWGDDGTDQVPNQIIVQAHVHMICIGSVGQCHIAAFLGGRGFSFFHVARNDDLCNTIADQSAKFWEDYVEKDIPPPDTLPSFDTIKRTFRVPEKTTDIDPDLVARWLAAKERAKESQDECDTIQKHLLTALGDSDAAMAGELGMVTYREQSARRFDAKRFRREQPDLASYYEVTSSYRVLRHKKPKGE